MSQRREHARRLLSAPASIAATTTGAVPASVHLIDISLSGVGFLHAGDLATGQEYTLQVQLPGQPSPVAFALTLVYCRAEPVREYVRCGAQITREVSPGAMAALVDFLTTPP